MTMNPTGPRLIGAQMQTQTSVDTVQEVAVQSSDFAAEFGATGGAMINMVTKSGTNDFHGSLYDYGTNEALNALQPYIGLRSKIRQHDWGFTIDPIAAKVLALAPQPIGVNFDRGLVSNNFTGAYDTSRTSNIPSIKIDQML